jgi:hypothetical protein
MSCDMKFSYDITCISIIFYLNQYLKTQFTHKLKNEVIKSHICLNFLKILNILFKEKNNKYVFYDKVLLLNEKLRNN